MQCVGTDPGAPVVDTATAGGAVIGTVAGVAVCSSTPGQRGSSSMTVGVGAFFQGIIVSSTGTQTGQIEVDVVVCAVNMFALDGVSDGRIVFSRLFVAFQTGDSTAGYMFGMAIGRVGTGCSSIGVVGRAVTGGAAVAGVAGYCSCPDLTRINLAAVYRRQVSGSYAGVAGGVAIKVTAGGDSGGVSAEGVTGVKFYVSKLVDMAGQVGEGRGSC